MVLLLKSVISFHLPAIFSGVKGSLDGKWTPAVRSQRRRAENPGPTSNNAQVVGAFSCPRRTTVGAIYSGLSFATYYQPKSLRWRPTTSSGMIVLVIAVPAVGAMTLTRILFFCPSLARAFVNPTIASFAVA